MPSRRLRAYLELIRLPNVFSALADVLAGWLLTHESLVPLPILGLLLASSAALYSAGMVLNDVFDLAVDAVERPTRPLPSRRISLGRARSLGYALLLFGMGFGWFASYVDGGWTSGIVASVLGMAIWSYDAALKRTALGPCVMGSCRALNILLGMSATHGAWLLPHWVVAAGVGVYIAGVTWFARREARESHRWHLAGALVTMIAGIALLAIFPLIALDVPESGIYPRFAPSRAWWTLMAIIAALIAWRPLRAITTPIPQYVQAAVKQCILSLIVLDAAVCLAVRGPEWALLILVLLVPAALLGRWIYST